ncbi:MAG: DUF924 family protein [Rhodospirillales bacterium]|nr:DUF924 family protein [Rhodospirillales bacterium]MDA8051529.1 DUF924 family protein [Rhodospirillales bacterium]
MDCLGPADVVAFWREVGAEKWFAKDAAFDAAFRERFLGLHMAVAARRHDDWLGSAAGALALILLTDQFPRNAFRGTAHMYATDPLARHHARQALAAGHWEPLAPELRLFLCLPFTHSEDLADQDLSVALHGRLGPPSLAHAEHHRDIVCRFGRFPHRNAMLARETTAEEALFLAEGGFAG